MVVERLYKCSAAAFCTEVFEVRLYTRRGGRYTSSFMCHKKAKNSVTQVYMRRTCQEVHWVVYPIPTLQWNKEQAGGIEGGLIGHE